MSARRRTVAPRRSAVAAPATPAAPAPRPVLVSGHGADADALNDARRLVPYRRLVLLSTAPRDDALAALVANERLANVDVDVRAVDGGDFLACLVAARAVLAEHAKDRVRVHVAGGPNLLTSALLLAAFQVGAEAFFCHPRGVSRLPVAFEVRIEDKFSDAERAVLAALPAGGEAAVGELDAGGLSPTALKGALLALRKRGLVRANLQAASLTPAGAYYRAHFATRAP